MSFSRIVIATLPLGCFVFACSSADVEAGPSSGDLNDASADTFVSPPDDAGAADAGPVDAAPAERLEVACAGDPCYLALSGNGGQHTCGLLKDGTVRCWGFDDGALGRGAVASILEGATPAPVVGLTAVTQISVGPAGGTCARTSEGALYCWGRNDFGQLGRPNTELRLLLPTRVEGLPPVERVALGAQTACAIASSDRSLYCWGSRTSPFGRSVPAPAAGESTTTFAPQAIPGFGAPLRELAIGITKDPQLHVNVDTVVALREGGVLATFGATPAGESSFMASIPPLIAREIPSVVHIGPFAYLGKDGLLRRWVPSAELLYVPSPSEVVQVEIAGATMQGGVLLSTGRLFRWGLNTRGALGVPPETLAYVEHPIEVSNAAGGPVVSFATTTASTCALLVDGSVRCWGSNVRGELGRGTVDSAPHPEGEAIR